MVMDPVCGMDVDEQSAEKLTYKEKKYFFCSRECKDEFRVSPEEFLELDNEQSETGA